MTQSIISSCAVAADRRCPDTAADRSTPAHGGWPTLRSIGNQMGSVVAGGARATAAVLDLAAPGRVLRAAGTLAGGALVMVSALAASASAQAAAATNTTATPMDLLRAGGNARVEHCTARHATRGVPDERILVHCLLNAATALVGDNIGTHTTFLRTLERNSPPPRTSGQVADLASRVDLDAGKRMVEQRLQSSSTFRTAMETLQALLPDMSAPFTMERLHAELRSAGCLPAFRSAAAVQGVALHAVLTRLGEEMYQLEPERMNEQGFAGFVEWRDRYYSADVDSLSGYQLNQMLGHLANHLRTARG